MASVLTTTETTAISDEFLPADDIILQATGAATVIVEVEARVDADAAWSYVTGWLIQSSAFLRVAQMPRMRVRIKNNVTGQTVTVRRSE